jgi:signal peptidase II
VNRADLRRSWHWFALSAAIVGADQLAKWAVLGFFAGREPRVELTGFFNLVLVCNKGAAFSFLADAQGWQTPLFIGFALVAAVVCSILIVRNPGKRLFCAGQCQRARWKSR